MWVFRLYRPAPPGGPGTCTFPRRAQVAYECKGTMLAGWRRELCYPDPNSSHSVLGRPRRMDRPGSVPNLSSPLPDLRSLSKIPRASSLPPCTKMREALWSAATCYRLFSGLLAGRAAVHRPFWSEATGKLLGIKAAASCRSPERTLDMNWAEEICMMMVKRNLVDERIIRDPKICGGQPVFKGTRVTLRTVLASLAEG